MPKPKRGSRKKAAAVAAEPTVELAPVVELPAAPARRTRARRVAAPEPNGVSPEPIPLPTPKARGRPKKSATEA